MAVQQDAASELHKAFMKIAVDAVSDLRDASDCAGYATPELVGKVQERVFKTISEVYFGTQEHLDSFS